MRLRLVVVSETLFPNIVSEARSVRRQRDVYHEEN